MKRFKSIFTMQDYIRKYNKVEHNIKVAGIELKITYYDMFGKEIIYSNWNDNYNITVTTQNRYGPNKFKDAVVDDYNL